MHSTKRDMMFTWKPKSGKKVSVLSLTGSRRIKKKPKMTPFSLEKVYFYLIKSVCMGADGMDVILVTT